MYKIQRHFCTEAMSNAILQILIRINDAEDEKGDKKDSLWLDSVPIRGERFFFLYEHDGNGNIRMNANAGKSK